MTALSCHDLRVRRADGFSLTIPHLELESGTVTALCGANGSGKSTLLLACAGLIDLDGGRVELDDNPHHQGRAPAPASGRLRTPLVHQDPYLLKGTVRRNLSWGLRLRDVPRQQRRERSAEILGLLGIDDLTARDVRRLSGGQQTLVAVARALVLRPTVLMFDEVTRDLDKHHRQAVMKAIQKQTSLGTAVLLATHDREMVEQLADTRVTLDNGQIASTAVSTKDR